MIGPGWSDCFGRGHAGVFGTQASLLHSAVSLSMLDTQLSSFDIVLHGSYICLNTHALA